MICKRPRETTEGWESTATATVEPNVTDTATAIRTTPTHHPKTGEKQGSPFTTDYAGDLVSVKGTGGEQVRELAAQAEQFATIKEMGRRWDMAYLERAREFDLV